MRAAAGDTCKALIERAGVEHRDDQQHPVGTGDARLGDLHRVEGEVLAQQGDVHRSANLREVLERTPNPGPSVSTEIAATPHAAYSLPNASGSSSGRSTPPLGERRFISAMTFPRGASRRCSARVASTRPWPRVRPRRTAVDRPPCVSAERWRRARRRPHSCADRHGNACALEEIAQQGVSSGRAHQSGMKLHTLDGKHPMAHGHDQAVIAPRGRLERRGSPCEATTREW